MTEQQEPSGTPGRYQRTFGGLIGSMIVMVVVVLGYVGFKSLFSEEPDARIPDPIDHLEAIGQLQSGGYEPVYPASLPAGWRATGFTVDPGERPSYGLNLYTDDDRFVGLRQADDDVEDLLEEFVDDEPVEEEPATGVPLGGTWDGWSDDGGDRAYAVTLPGDQTVVVFGEVPDRDLRDLLVLLTTDPVPSRR